MVVVIFLLALISFGVFYPLCFFTQYRYPVRGDFNRIQLGLASAAAGLGAALLYREDVVYAVRVLGIIWSVGLLGVTAWHWKREAIQEWLVAGASLPGLVTLTWAQGQLLQVDWLAGISTALGSTILCAALFSAMLGYWYLNVRAMSSRHLYQAVKFLALLLLVRLIWDLVWISSERVFLTGRTVSLWHFCSRGEGVYLGLAVLFGTLTPLFLMGFTLKTLKAKSTGTASSLLFAVALLVVMGEMAYRYYLAVYKLAM